MNVESAHFDHGGSRADALPCSEARLVGRPEQAVAGTSPAEQAAAEAYAELCAKVVSTFNHDLRTPLTTLLAHTELLLEAEAMPDAAQRSLDAMRRAGETIKQRLADLVLSVDVHERGFEDRIHVHLASLLRGAVREAESLFPGTGIRLTAIGTEGLVTVVNAPLLRCAVVELLHNALNDAPKGSTIHVSSRVEAAQVCIEFRHERSVPAAQGRVSSPTADGALRLRGSALAIAGAVAAAHGGRLVSADAADGEFSATLCLDLLTVWGG